MVRFGMCPLQPAHNVNVPQWTTAGVCVSTASMECLDTTILGGIEPPLNWIIQQWLELDVTTWKVYTNILHYKDMLRFNVSTHLLIAESISYEALNGQSILVMYGKCCGVWWMWLVSHLRYSTSTIRIHCQQWHLYSWWNVILQEALFQLLVSIYLWYVTIIPTLRRIYATWDECIQIE